MPKVLIADAIKPSLVMSSEIFKDKIPGATIFVATTGEDAIRIAELEKPDLCLVDFDLPDVDGPALVVALRKVYQGPILMTAFPDKNVTAAVEDDLFAYNDASAWVSKPIKFDELADKIDKFLIEHHRTGRRFSIDLPMKLIAKAAGRGKRAPKSNGTVINLSLGGARLQLDGGMKVKKNQEITIAIEFPLDLELSTEGVKEKEKVAKPRSSGKRGDARRSGTLKGSETKLKATVAWHGKGGQIGVMFNKLTDIQLKGLETFLRSEAHGNTETPQ